MSNLIFGVSAGHHDAGLSIIDKSDGEILFASHSERFSKKKHDAMFCDEMLDHVLSEYGRPDTIAYYENHWLKKYRQLRAGQRIKPFNFTLRGEIQQHFTNHEFAVSAAKLKSFNHHMSHAASGFQTSPYDHATVVVIDAIGEMDTITIWDAHYDKHGMAQYELKWRQGYPNSIGLFYSAITGSVGLHPLDEEYILMGMAAYGEHKHTADLIRHHLVESISPPRFKENLHIGIDSLEGPGISKFDAAAGAQYIAEQMIMGVMERSLKYNSYPSNLVYMGGVALNCSANRLLGNYYSNIWIMPNPGDAGCSLGAAALAYGKKLQWNDAFLGYNIEGEYPVDDLVGHLFEHGIAGVANGNAEFGPRALGNRSLLADPRGADTKDKVNVIKHRQEFRPFAPVILEEHVDQYFDMPRGFSTSEFMQVTAKCKRPKDFPAIVHKDGTSRVQTVPANDTGIRRVLERWFTVTGCPMLLNTSLNIRGEPMVNDKDDAARFEKEYGVKVFTHV